jgi:alpha-mannosidase
MSTKKSSKSNPIWFVGVTDPEPIGYYSGTKRDFEEEAKSEEMDTDFPIEVYQSGVEDSVYDEPEFQKAQNEYWEHFMKMADEDLSQKYLIYFISQSHIDVMWKWRLAQCVKKAQYTFGRALKHMDLYSDFTFTASQPFLFECILRSNPEMFKSIVQRVKENRFELVGGSWTEYDPRMPSGEALARQRLYGQRFYLKYFGKLAEIEWHPDSFGYSLQLPQFIARSGGKYFFTTKFSNAKDTTFPFCQFKWFSPDGSNVFSYFSPGGFGAFTSWRKFKPSRRLLKKGQKLQFDYSIDKVESLPIWSDEIPPLIGLIYGKGDGGHGPAGEEYARMRLYIDEGKNLKVGTALELFHELEKLADRVPEFHDELYYEFHRGTLTSHHLVKLMNRRSEWMTQSTENLASLMSLLTDTFESRDTGREKDITFNYPYLLFTIIWRDICILHMHDILPGSSIPEVYDEAHDIWKMMMSSLNKIRIDIVDIFAKANNIVKGETGILMMNPLDINRKEVVEIPWGNKQKIPKFVKDAHGNLSPVQFIPIDHLSLDIWEKRPDRIIFSTDIAALSSKTIELIYSSNSNEDNKVNSPANKKKTSKLSNEKQILQVKCEEIDDGICLENKFYQILINKKTGSIDSLKIIGVDANGKSLPALETLDKPSNVLEGFYDFALEEQAWNISPSYRNMPFESGTVKIKHIKICETGPVRWTVEINSDWNNEDVGHAEFWQYISIYALSEGIDCDILADWQMKDSIIKCFYSIARDPEESIAEIPYGTIHRSLYPKANHDIPRWENHMHNFLSIPAKDGSFCFNILNRGKYAFDNIEGNKIGISTLRAPLYTNVPNVSWIVEERKKREQKGEGTVPTHADLGHHLIQYRLMPKRGSWKEQFIERDAHAFNSPILSDLIQFKALETDSPLTTTDGLELASIKIAEEPNENLLDMLTPDKTISQVNDATINKLKVDRFVIRVYETQGFQKTGEITIKTKLNIKDVVACDLIERNISIPKTKGLLTSDPIKLKKDTTGNIIAIEGKWAPHEIKSFILSK